MAYKGYSFKYVGTRDSMWAYIQAFMIEIGWTLHDDISETVKVYKSNGESGKEPYGYVWIDGGTSTYIQFGLYQYWDEVNHIGYRQQTGGAGTTVQRLQNFGTVGDAVLAGDKDFVWLIPYAENAVYGVHFGHLPVRFDPNIAYAMGTAGTCGTLLVSDSTYFGAGKYMQIVGAGTEGCEGLQVQEVVDAQNIIVTKLSNNYGTGSVIGAPASVFGWCSHSSYYNRFYPTSHYSDSGTTVSASYSTIYHITGWHSYYHHFSKKRCMNLIMVVNDSVTDSGIMLGMFGTNCSYPFLSTWDISGWNTSGEYGTAGTATTGGSSLVIETGKNWTADIHANRFFVVESGTGAGQMKKILGNDATSLTLQGTLGTAFGASRYKIYDHVWRQLIYVPSQGANASIRITDTIAPTI